MAFHGFSKRPGDADLYIGGGASRNAQEGDQERSSKRQICLCRLALPRRTTIRNSRAASPENLINRLAAQGIHIEQSAEARKFSENIAKAIATVYRSPIRRFLCALTNLFR